MSRLRGFLVAVALLGTSSLAAPVPLAAQDDVTPAIQEAAAQRVWMRTYLRLYDQLLATQAALGQISASEADARLAAVGRELYERGYHDDDIDVLREQLQVAADVFLTSLEGEIATSTTWPSDAPVEVYRSLSQRILGYIRTDLAAALAQGADPLPLLREATQLLAFARGLATVPSELDFFSAGPERAAGAMPGIELMPTGGGAPPLTPPPSTGGPPSVVTPGPLVNPTVPATPGAPGSRTPIRVVLPGGTVEGDARLVGRGSTDMVGRTTRPSGDGLPDTEIELRLLAPGFVVEAIEVRHDASREGGFVGGVADRLRGMWSTRTAEMPVVGVVSNRNLLNRANGSLGGITLVELSVLNLFIQDDGQLEGSASPATVTVVFRGGEQATFPITTGRLAGPVLTGGGRTPPVIVAGIPPRTPGAPGGVPPITVPTGGGVTPGDANTTWGTNATSHRGQNGQRFSYTCPRGGSAGSVWGTDVYTDDTSICTAAVHAGLITFAGGGTVTIEIRRGQSGYPGSTRNGVQTATYPAWSGSFAFVGAGGGAGGAAPPPTTTFAGSIQTDRATYTEGQPITVTFSGFPGTNDWIALAPAGAAAESYGEWHWTDRRTSGTMTFTAPAAGSYELRVLLDWPNGGYNVRATRPFTVGAPAPTFTSLPADFPANWRWESDGGWTGAWTRRGTSDLFDAAYQGPSGQRVNSVEEMTRQASQIRVRRVASSDNVVCNLEGAIQAGGGTIRGTGACPGINSGWGWRLTLGTAPVTPPVAGGGVTPGDANTTWGTNATPHRGKNAQRFSYACPRGGSAGSVWGTDVYTDDTSICTAAVHAGLITFAGGGTVTIEIRPGQSGYPGSTRNGVQSSTYPAWSGSFAFVGAGGAVPPTTFAGSIQTDRATYAPGETITVAFSGFPGTNDWIALAPAGAAAESYGEWHWTDRRTSGTMTFTAPAAGSYELRVLLDWPNGGYNVRATRPITVSAATPTASVNLDAGWVGTDTDVVGEWGNGAPDGRPDGHFTLDLSSGSAYELRSMMLFISDAAGNRAGSDTWHTQSTSYWMLRVATNGQFLNASHVATLGSYQGSRRFDLFANGNNSFNDGQYFTIEVDVGLSQPLRRTVMVRGGTTPPTTTFAGTVQTDRATYTEGQPITVTFSGFPATNDWIAIAPAGSGAESYGEWKWTDGSSTSGAPSGAPRMDGTLTFTAPAPGSYELRVFLDWPAGGHTIRASRPFTVGVAAPTFTSLPADFPTNWTWESDGGWTGTWTRRGTSDQFDASYLGPGGQRVTTLEELMGSGDQIRGRRLSSSDNVLCNLEGVVRRYAEGGLAQLEGTGACPGSNSGWGWRLTPATGGPPPTTTFAGSIQTDRATYAEGQTITVTFSGFPGTNDWIAMAPAGAAAETYGEWHWTDQRASGTMTFTAPAAGSYELRVFLDWSNGGYTVRATRPITVGGGMPQDITVAYDASWVGMEADVVSQGGNVAPDGSADAHFTLDVDINAPYDVRSITLFSSDAQGNASGGQVWHTQNSGYWVLGVTSQGTMLNAGHVASLGTHQGYRRFDLYAASSGWFNPGQAFVVEADVGMSQPLRAVVRIPDSFVPPGTEPPATTFAGSIQTDRATYQPGETITVTFSGLPGTNDWIALAPAGAAAETYGEWHWTDQRTSGTMTFTAPAAGSYEVRVFLDWSNGGYNVRATRPFTVGGAMPQDITVAYDAAWVGMDADAVSQGASAAPDGSADGHFTLFLDINAPYEVRYVTVFSSDAQGNPSGGQVWHTQSGGYWVLGVASQGTMLNTGHVASLGTHQGQRRFELFAASSGYFNPGQHFVVEVDVGLREPLRRVVVVSGGQVPVGGGLTMSEVAGTWAWFTGHTVIISQEGTANGGDFTGPVEIVDPAARRIRITWSHGYVDELVLRADGNRLEGANQQGTAVWGDRTSGAPARARNAALNRPAQQSSVSQWSDENDAQGAVDGQKTGSYGFHTESEPNPWWAVDLGEVIPLREIRVFNRIDCCPERAASLQILVSNDQTNWQTVYSNPGTPFGGTDGHPLVVDLRGRSGRYVMLRLAETTHLHLDEVEIDHDLP